MPGLKIKYKKGEGEEEGEEEDDDLGSFWLLTGVTASPDGEEFSHLSEASIAISEIPDLPGDVEEMGLRTASLVIS